MKTNLGVETSDEQRLNIGKKLGLGRMVSRKELRTEIERYVEELGSGKEVKQEPDQTPTPPATNEPPASRDRSVPRFVPSRGDESYLYKPKNPELAAACSTVLDGLEHIEEYVWEQLEKNRL